MSQAYRSTLDISFDVRGGLLMRRPVVNLPHQQPAASSASTCAAGC